MFDREHAAFDLGQIRAHWPDLHEAKTRSSAHRRQGPTAGLLRDWMAEQQALEHAERTDLAPGWAPVPADLDVVETMIRISDTILTLEQRARLEGGQEMRPRPRPEPGEYDERVPWAARALESELLDCDEQLALDIAVAASWCAHAAKRALDLAERVRPLPATCPFDGGPLVLRTETPCGAVVLCMGDGCDPASWSGRFRRRPAWLPGEWEGLAALLRASAPPAA